MLANCARGVDDPRVQSDHHEALVLQLDGPFRHHHERRRLRHMVRSHPGEAVRTYGLRIGVARFQ